MYAPTLASPIPSIVLHDQWTAVLRRKCLRLEDTQKVDMGRFGILVAHRRTHRGDAAENTPEFTNGWRIPKIMGWSGKGNFWTFYINGMAIFCILDFWRVFPTAEDALPH